MNGLPMEDCRTTIQDGVVELHIHIGIGITELATIYKDGISLSRKARANGEKPCAK